MLIVTNQMPGWEEWQTKLNTLAAAAPQFASLAVSEWRKVIEPALKSRTQSAGGLTERIRAVALTTIGHSYKKGQRDTQRTARVGYGVGKRTISKRISIRKGTLNDYAGKRSIYRRYKITRSKRKDTSIANAFIKRMTFGKRGGRGGKFLGMIGLRRAKKLGRMLSRKKTVVKSTRLKGVGISKRNAHWLVLGSYKGQRTVKNWMGSGRPHQVGKFKPYLMGILDTVLRSKASEAYAAAELRVLEAQQKVINGKIGSTLRSMARNL